MNTATSVVVQQPVDTGLRFDKKVPAPRGLMARLAFLYARLVASDEPNVARAQIGIHAFVGLNGSGKTLCMVRSVERELAGVEWECFEEDHLHNDPQFEAREIVDPISGEVRMSEEYVGHGPLAVHKGMVRVLSTVRMFDPETGKPHPRYERFSDWKQLENLEHAVLVMDEITGVAHSRDGGSLPHDIMNRLMQLRKGEVRVLWSAPHWMRAEKLIREVTQAITVCDGSYPDRGGSGIWKPNRLFRWRTFETGDFDEWTAGRAKDLKPVVTELFWGPGSLAFRLYNTKQKVTRLGHASDAGLCTECGGTRRRPECSCHSYVASKAERRAAAKAVTESQ